MIKRISPLASLAGKDNRFSVVEDEPDEVDEFEAGAALEENVPPYAEDGYTEDEFAEDDPLADLEIDLTRIAEASKQPKQPIADDIRPFPAPVRPAETAPEPEMAASPEPEVAEDVPSPLQLGEPLVDTGPEEIVEPPETAMPPKAAEPAKPVEPEKSAKPVKPEDAPKASDAPSTMEPAKRRSSRVKTTLLGFDRSDGRSEDIFDTLEEKNATVMSKFPTGWLVVIKGEGRGTSISLHSGVHQIGRGDDQAIQLDFGDTGISRSNHAAIAFDDETKSFFLGHGGKANIVRLNGTPVLSTEPLNDGDLIRIGETTLRFVAFCSEEFSWSDDEVG